MAKRWVGAAAAALGLLALQEGCVGCTPAPPPPEVRDGGGDGGDGPDAGSPDSGTPGGGGMPDGGGGGGTPDAGGFLGAGPWPEDEVKNYSAAYNLGPIQSAGLDDGFNLWLLSGNRVGVLRPGDRAPTWSENLGQAGRGFPSSVICGGRAGQAFVGYIAADPGDPRGEPAYKAEGHRRWQPSDGDADSVVISSSGAPVLEEHINLYNSNDLHWNEAASVVACLKVVRGPAAGDVFLGNNHGVTRLRAQGCEATWAANPRHENYRTCYDDHRHPAWYLDKANGQWVPDERACAHAGGATDCRLMIGYNYALGVAQNGDLLVANEWKFGVTLTTPDPTLEQWHQFGQQPWRLEFYVPELNSMEAPDAWRGFTQATDGRYYLGSKDHGLWQFTATLRPNGVHLSPAFEKVPGVPSGSISALTATDDGSLFIGTAGDGLWRMTPARTFHRVPGVEGRTVRMLAYDPRFTPSMLLVLTDAGLFVLRGR